MKGYVYVNSHKHIAFNLYENILLICEFIAGRQAAQFAEFSSILAVLHVSPLLYSIFAV